MNVAHFMLLCECWLLHVLIKCAGIKCPQEIQNWWKKSLYMAEVKLN